MIELEILNKNKETTEPESALKFNIKSALSVELIVIGLIIILGCFLRLSYGPGPIDDAYITYRYVENIANGNGFAYNIGEHILGTTTPLYTLLLSLFYFIFRVDIPWLSLIINTLADVITIVLLWRVSKHLAGKLEAPKVFVFIPPFLFSIALFSVKWCMSGMETSIFVLLSISCLYFFIIRRNDNYATVFAGLTTLCRPEGVVLLGLILAYALFFRRRNFLKQLLIVAVVIGPWLLFAMLYFGNFIPESVLAKTSKAYVLDDNFLYNFSLFLQALTDNPIGQIVSNYFIFINRNLLLGYLTVLMLPFYLVGAGCLAKLKEPRYFLIFAFPFLFIGIYAISVFKNRSFIFEWYIGPVIPWLILLLSLCMIGLWLYFSKKTGLFSKIGRVIVISILIVSVLNQFYSFVFGSPQIPPRRYYEQAAKFLQPYLKKGDTVAAPEIGEFGYFSQANILDSVGLVSPEALKFYPVPENEMANINTVPTRMILEYRPEFVLSLDIFMRNSLQKSPDFLNSYTILKTWPNHDMTSENLFIYIRNDLIDRDHQPQS